MKFCLNEINSFVLVIFFNEADIKAEYSVVTNIGGMIPQHIFLPIEEISYNMFSKLEKEGDISTGEKQRQKEEKIPLFWHFWRTSGFRHCEGSPGR